MFMAVQSLCKSAVVFSSARREFLAVCWKQCLSQMASLFGMEIFSQMMESFENVYKQLVDSYFRARLPQVASGKQLAS